MSFFSIPKMVTNYNDAIETCELDSLSANASSNPVICGLETIMQEPISSRLKVKEDRVLEDDEEEKSHMSKTMCGCRLTARVMFVMLILGIAQPSGKNFIEIYNHLFESDPSNVVNTIMGRGLNMSEINSINSGQVSNVTLYLTPSSDLFIVQILKYIDWLGSYSPVHSFIIRNLGDGSCQVLSSWFAGGDTMATPILEKTLSCEELNQRLQPQNLLDETNTNFLFGQGNNLDGNLVTIFIAKEAIIPLTTGGRKNKTKKNKRKRKTK
jgi:hypothetical protein